MADHGVIRTVEYLLS